jgi:N6-L-threonylcarbamoyladenine synthase
MKILAIDTSCDETAAAVTENKEILSNIVWSQASLHAKFGGVLPSLAQRKHEERIDFVIEKALKTSGVKINNIDAIAVTIGPGLSIALGVGINKAKELAKKYSKPLIPMNHVESHLLSPLAHSDNKFNFPAFGLVLSGKNTLFALVENIGKYRVLAETQDDALGEALDKSARLLGFGYPGAHILEKLAKEGNPNYYELPIPLSLDKVKDRFSYSGLKTAFVRLFNSIETPNKNDLSNLAAGFQNAAFEHIIKVLNYQISEIKSSNPDIKDLVFGGGVANNIEIRKRLRNLCKIHKLNLHIPYTKKLLGDNAAMIGVTAYLKYREIDLSKFKDFENIDRNPKLKITDKLPFS